MVSAAVEKEGHIVSAAEGEGRAAVVVVIAQEHIGVVETVRRTSVLATAQEHIAAAGQTASVVGVVGIARVHKALMAPERTVLGLDTVDVMVIESRVWA
jgi:hypothetical protein